MKALFHTVAVVLVALMLPTAFAQETGAHADHNPQAGESKSPAEFDKQMAKMHEHMTKMQEEMRKIQQTQDPQERQRSERTLSSMQSMMTMMSETRGGKMECCAKGDNMMEGHMKGGPMMGKGGPTMNWDSYQKLTPEQLKERQYKMDRWITTQQMMMEHMMQHHHMMRSATAPPAAPRK